MKESSVTVLRLLTLAVRQKECALIDDSLQRVMAVPELAL